MNDEKSTKNEKVSKVLYPDLSYNIVGCAFKVHKLYGTGHKESLYQEALANEMSISGISYKREPIISIINPITKEKLRSNYRPDFLIEDKIIVEIKAQPKLAQFFYDQIHDYLHNSEYELGYLINFAEKKIIPHRVIYTNDKKSVLVRRDGT